LTVNFDPEPISYEALDNRLRIMRQQAASIHAIITAAHMDLEWDLKFSEASEPIKMVMRELRTMEALIGSALMHAESVADQIKRETA
jgi:hypothetical protein